MTGPRVAATRPASRPAGTRLHADAIDRYGLRPPLAAGDGSVPLATFAVARRLATRMNEQPRDLPAIPSELAAMGLLDQILRRVVEQYRERVDPAAMDRALADLRATLGVEPTDGTTAEVDRKFRAATAPAPPEEAPELLEDTLHVWLANSNPALAPYADLVDDRTLAAESAYPEVVRALARHFRERSPLEPGGQSLVDVLRRPAVESPASLAGQLRWIRDNWGELIGEFNDRLLVHLDVLTEEELGQWRRFNPAGPGGGGDAAASEGYGAIGEEPERFSADSAWMPRVVLIARSTYVWLDQLSRRHGREIRTLDAIPSEELDQLASWGVTGLWLIGLWERSNASATIKRLRGNPEAVASAYSLDDYRIADDLGGEAALQDLRERAWARGIRLASDMVPNHMGIDSRWVLEHPDRFLSIPEPPYSGYTFNGPDLSPDERVGIFIEDGYWDASDAAVVFRRLDRTTGESRYVYHGNDGTSFPWNDTAQLNYLAASVREAVIQTILDVARRFPIIRFDAAMTLAKRHIQRLWFPEPGGGGAIPSRAEWGSMSKQAFERAMPEEFWREVVDRVAAEVPDTLLLAEAFWLMEGYFVRTLGMHRVYNSAFMHMFRDEKNAAFRKLIGDTLEFDPEILKRYVNFMNNPDEKTAVEQFGKGDKYFGVATVLATLPGLPMLGHGQVEGFAEKYGMEYRRAYHDEAPDEGLVAHHERVIFPLLHRRAQFAEAARFNLYDFVTSEGAVNEDVFAYSNIGPTGERSLVLYHNRFGTTTGRIGRSIVTGRTLGEGLDIPAEDGLFVTYRDGSSGLEHLVAAHDLAGGLGLVLRAYEYHVFLDLRTIRDGSAGQWGRLAARLGGGGVPFLEDALLEQQLQPVHAPLHALAREASPSPDRVRALAAAVAEAIGVEGSPDDVASVAGRRLAAIAGLAAALDRSTTRSAKSDAADPLAPVRAAFADPWHRAVLEAWSVLEPLGRLAIGTMAGPTSRALFDELRLGPVLAAGLRERDLDEAAAWQVVERLRVLLALPRPSNVGGRSAADRARRLVQAWFAHPDVRGFLGVNTWEGIEWFGREAWRDLLDWTLLLDAVDGKPVRSSRAVVDRLLEAGEASGYRVDRLLAQVDPKRGQTRARDKAPAPRTRRPTPKR
jgi:glycosidase